MFAARQMLIEKTNNNKTNDKNKILKLNIPS